MERFIPSVILLLVASTGFADALPTAISVQEVAKAVAANTTTGLSFAIEGEIIYPTDIREPVFVISDGSNAVSVCDKTGCMSTGPLAAGHRIRISGTTRFNDYGNVCAEYDTLEIMSKGLPPSASSCRLTPSDLRTGAYDYKLATLRGTVRDVFNDEIDAKYLGLLVNDAHNSAYVTVFLDASRREDFDRLIGSEIAIEGISIPRTEGMRIHIGRTFMTQGTDGIRILKDKTSDLFDVPLLEDLRNVQPSDVANLGRRRVFGRVSAVWGGTHVILHTGSRVGPLLAELANPRPPAVGDTVEIVGFPVTDLYRINLRRAKWRPSQMRAAPAPGTPTVVRAKDIFTDEGGSPRINAMLFGNLLSVTGRVLGLPTSGKKDQRMYLACDGFILAVDIGASPDLATRLQPDSQVEATGVCVMETESWQTDSAFPGIKDVFLVTRRDADIRITARPPWWTPGRLLAVISSLLTVLVAVLLWNTSLRRLAERRGRDLFRTEIDKAGAELKTYERTRLAIELHDMLSQMLSGISMQIGTVRKFFETNREEALHHLDIADRTLHACRESLRDCLWDLRNSALEEPDMNMAIRKTLEPHIENTSLAIRFNIPRDRLSDNTAHAILSIIRELTVNALRHGNATSIRIAGCIDGENVLFSVSDNGCGFDPGKAPGMAQGHFGLQGIQERVEGFEGDMDISGGVGQGVKVSIRLNLPTEKPRDTEHA